MTDPNTAAFVQGAIISLVWLGGFARYRRGVLRQRRETGVLLGDIADELIRGLAGEVGWPTPEVRNAYLILRSTAWAMQGASHSVRVDVLRAEHEEMKARLAREMGPELDTSVDLEGRFGKPHE